MFACREAACHLVEHGKGLRLWFHFVMYQRVVTFAYVTESRHLAAEVILTCTLLFSGCSLAFGIFRSHEGVLVLPRQSKNPGISTRGIEVVADFSGIWCASVSGSESRSNGASTWFGAMLDAMTHVIDARRVETRKGAWAETRSSYTSNPPRNPR